MGKVTDVLKAGAGKQETGVLTKLDRKLYVEGGGAAKTHWGVLHTLEHGVPQEQAGMHPGTREKLHPRAASFPHPLSTLLQVATGEMFTGPRTSVTAQNEDMWTGSGEAMH